MLVCLFSIEIQTTRRIWMKFGTEVVLKGRKVLGFFTLYPTPGGPLEPQPCILAKTL